MNNLKVLLAGLTVSLLGVSAAQAEHKSGHYDGYDSPSYVYRAKIVEVRPLYKYVTVNNPSKKCRYETRTHEHTTEHKKSGVGSTLLGGVLGGLLGNQVGKGRGKKAATIVGVIVGAKIGSDAHRRRNSGHEHVQSHTERVRVCRRVNNSYEERRRIGFRVKYIFNDDTYTTRMKRRPGRTLKLRVRATPLERKRRHRRR